MVPHVLAASAATTGPSTWWRRSAPLAVPGSRRSTSTSSTARPVRARTTGRTHWRLSLRTRSGVPGDALTEVDAIAHLVERRGDRMVLTSAGRLLANEVAVRLN
jgi:hypothetical protein